MIDFLKKQRLLEKEPKKRLTWPDLLHHPFVCGKLNMLESDAHEGLTKALSPSQELAKEMERQALTRKLVAYNKYVRSHSTGITFNGICISLFFNDLFYGYNQ